MSTGEQVFLFEYATCSSHSLPPSVAVEGCGMFKALFEGFQNPISFYHEPRYLELFKEFLERSEYVLTIAPETDMELFRLTGEIEKSGTKNLGSSKEAVRIATDKFLTYERLKDLSPKTHVYKGKTRLDFPLIAKPRDGVSCEGVMLVRGEEELEKVPSGYLVQEYVPGRPMSASLLVGDEDRLLSINTQELVDFKYKGAKLPVKLSNTEGIMEAVHRIPGLFGYVGVDFVLRDGCPVIIEVNPRPTTPIIALNRALGINVSELIIRNFNGRPLPDFKPSRMVHLKKTSSKSGYVSCNGSSIEIEDIYEDISL